MYNRITDYNIYDLKGMEDLEKHTKVLPPEKKKLVLMFLKHCGYDTSDNLNNSYYYDPVTGIKCNFNNSKRYACNGYVWYPAHIYLLEKYDIRLSKDFLSMFSGKEKMWEDIYEICNLKCNRTAKYR